MEEIDALFESEKHSSVPDVEMVRTGEEKLNTGSVEAELQTQFMNMKAE